MEQKLKKVLLLALLVVLIGGIAVYFLGKNDLKKQSAQPKNTETVKTQSVADPELMRKAQEYEKKIARDISGRIRSINEKAFYLELEGGTGFAVNFMPATPVILEGSDKTVSVKDLKNGLQISAKVNDINYAVEILIKK